MKWAVTKPKVLELWHWHARDLHCWASLRCFQGAMLVRAPDVQHELDADSFE